MIAGRVVEERPGSIPGATRYLARELLILRHGLAGELEVAEVQWAKGFEPVFTVRLALAVSYQAVRGC
jgi:hypothetical protein